MRCRSRQRRRARGAKMARPLRLLCLLALVTLSGCATAPRYLPYAECGDPLAQRLVAAAYEQRGERQAARAYYEKAAEAGDVTAMMRVAALCGEADLRDPACESRWARAALDWAGRGDAGTFEEAFARVHRLAEAGDLPAQRALARLHGAGLGVEENQPLAASWLIKAAEQGDAQAQLDLARRYFYAEEAVVVRPPGGRAPVVRDYRTVGQEESGLAHDNARAVLWARRAAEQNLGEAQLFLAHAHALGQGTALSAAEAERWFVEAAAHGQGEAIFLLARMYDDGAPGIRDPVRAAHWYLRAAEEGHRAAQTRLAEMYFFGQGVERDRQAAGRWAMAAAGLADADDRLRVFLAQGIARGFPNLPSPASNGADADGARPDPDWEPVLFTSEGLPRFPASLKGEWLLAAAQGGQVAAQVQLFLAHLVTLEALPLEPEPFAALVQRGAEAGDASAQRLLAALHFVGLGVAKSPRRATEWLAKSASATSHPADALLLSTLHLLGLGVEASDAEASAWVERAAQSGSTAARRVVATLHLAGVGGPPDLARAIEMMREAAMAGDGEAQRILGAMYRRGLPQLERNDAEAARWLRMAGSQARGHASAAQVALAGLYYEGQGVVQSAEMAAQWLDRARAASPEPAETATSTARSGMTEGSARGEPAEAIADLFFQQLIQRLDASGDGAALDLIAPRLEPPWLRRAAVQGFLPAQLFLAARATEKQEALRWYLVAANQGSLTAQLALKDLFNFRFILQWTRDAAEQGHLSSQIELAEKYRFGDGVDRDLAEAERWYLRAAEQDLETQVKVADIYFRGQGRLRGDGDCPDAAGAGETRPCPWPQDKEKAAQLYRRAAERGHKGAQLTMARLCERGEGVEQSFERAVRWYRLAAEQGDLGAQLRLAKAFERGIEITRNAEQVLKWYLKAAEQGDREAQFQVAQMYEQGSGTPHHPEEAARWYLRAGLNGQRQIGLIEKAAALGHADGQYWLARAYAEGQGVGKDIERSVQYLQRAAAQGHPEAQHLLARALDTGEGLARDQAEAARLYLSLIDRVEDPVPLRLRLAEMHARGEGVEKSAEQALKWYLSAAQTSPEAQVRVAQSHRRGIGTAKASKEAARWYLQTLRRLARPANAVDAPFCLQNLNKWEVISALELAEMYALGEGVPQSTALFLHWTQLALCSGQDKLFTEVATSAAPFIEFLSRSPAPGGLSAVDAQLLVARAHQGAAASLPDPLSRTKAMGEALAFYRRAAAAGSAPAHFALSGIHRGQGVGAPHDLGAALHWCEKGLRLGDGIPTLLSRELFHPFDSCEPAEIHYELGREGLAAKSPKKIREALNWLDAAARQGHRLATLELIDLYEEGGRGVRRNQKTALKWMTRLAESGDLEMRLRLARMYEHGTDGAGRDAKAAFHWYRAAAEGGDPGALRALARAHELGIGVEKNPELAAQLYESAFAKYSELYKFNPWLLVDMAEMASSGQGIGGRDLQRASRDIDRLLNGGERTALAERPELMARVRRLLQRLAAQGDEKSRENLRMISNKKNK